MKCLNVLLMFYLICIFSLSANFLSEEDKLLIAQHFNSYVDEGKLPHISILIKQNNKEIFTNISKFYATNPENLNLSLKTNDELPISFKQKIFETDIDKVAFGSDENAIYFANIKSIKMPEEGQNTSNINLIGDLKTAFGSEIIKTKEISFNDELINGLLSQYK